MKVKSQEVQKFWSLKFSDVMWKPAIFSREHRRYGKNPVIQMTTCAKDKIINHGTENSHYCVGELSDFAWLVSFMACLRILSCRYSDISLEAFLLKEFRTSGYNSEGFVIMSRCMPVFITYLPYQIFSLLEHKDYTNVTWILLTDLC